MSLAAALVGTQPAIAAQPAARPATAATLAQRLGAQFNAVGGASSGIAYDLKSGKTLWEQSAWTQRLPASVEKLLTTSSVLLELGPDHQFLTRALTDAPLHANGTLHGNLYLKGGGDPTLGYTRIGALAQAVHAAGINHIDGKVIGDDGYFDRIRGVPAQGPGIDQYLGGSLSGLVYQRSGGALTSALRFTEALRRAHVSVPGRHTTTGTTPLKARMVAHVGSPPVSSLIAQTNTPSDNLLAEMLIKDLGAERGGSGSTAAGTKVAMRRLAQLGIHPWMSDGSGIARNNWVSPHELVVLLRSLYKNSAFFNSLSVAGRTGTLRDRMRSGAAAGRCHGKTGTLSNVSALVGYCPPRNGGMIVFALLMNRVDPIVARRHQDSFAQILGGWQRP